MNFSVTFLIVLTATIVPSCIKIDELKDTGVSYATIESDYPDTTGIVWEEIGSAKEILNISEQLVYLSRGDNPIPAEKWDDFKLRLPWAKNIDRFLLFDKTYFYRSVGRPADCEYCETVIEYKGYTWTKLAEIIGVSYIPEGVEDDGPEPGHLFVQTINKCQLVYFEAGRTVYDLTDNQGNTYIMHATETGTPTTEVELPEGWSISTRVLLEPFVLAPFGGGDDCYFNIVRDHLGQGYHQYEYSGATFPE